MSDSEDQSQADEQNDQETQDEAKEIESARGNDGKDSRSEAREVKDLPAWAQKQIRDLRREAGDYRKKAQEFEDRDKTELQKAQDAAKRFEDAAKESATQVMALRAENQVRDAAEKAGARNPRLVYRLVKDDLELDDGGKVTNLEAVLKEAKRDSPELFGAGNGKADGGRGTQERGATGMNALLRQKAGYAGG